MKTRQNYLFLNIILLSISATLVYDWRLQVLTALLLFLPFIDRPWLKKQGTLPSPLAYKNRWLIVSIFTGVLAGLFFSYPAQQKLLIATLFFTALPEEFFFRTYLLTKVSTELKSLRLLERVKGVKQSDVIIRNASNIAVSIFFSLMHVPTQGIAGLLVFFPSLVFGWLYQKTNDLLLIVLVHGLSNLIFVLFIQRYWFKLDFLLF